MVLIRALVAMVLVVCAGCGESLFDAHGGRGDGGPGDDGGGDDAAVPTMCPSPCLGDAAADFNGMQGGSIDNRWHYYDDHRDRTWMQMTPSMGKLRGGDSLDQIASCDGSSSAACVELPRALLITSTGAAASDPAIEYKAPLARVIQLSFLAHVPEGGAAQRLVFYRNSREDVLFTGNVMPGATVSQTFPAVDALQGDRFLIAFEPLGAGGEVALRFFVNGTSMSFPSSCSLAVSFESASGSMIEDRCDSSYSFTSMQYVAPPGNSVAVSPILGNGPFLEQGNAADIALGRYYSSPPAHLLKRADTTIQFWVRQDNIVPQGADLFSNVDQEEGGGINIKIIGASARRLQVSTYSKPNAATFIGRDVDYPTDGLWHFLRMVHTSGMVHICMDGIRRDGFPLAADGLESKYPVYLGKNVEWDMSVAPGLDGGLDDVRVFSAALPCE